MRKLFWLVFLFGAYLWIMTSGHDQMLLNQGKNVYRAFLAWFEDADVDFQMEKAKKSTKRSRRWD